MVGPNVYNVKDVIVRIDVVSQTSSVTIPEAEVTEIAPDGFVIDPSVEHTLIETLKGPSGFNVDPTTAATITLNLRSTSVWNSFLSDAFTNNVILSFTVTSKNPSATGFETKKVNWCMVQKPAQVRTDGKEAPVYEWTLIGYGLE